MAELTPFQKQHLRGMQLIIQRLDRQNELLERRATGRLRVFLRKTSSAFFDKLSTNLGHWLAGLPLWLLALEGLGLRHLLAKWFGFSM